ncbi:salicylate synthase [Streptomyces lonarensis]|uniref:Salicylate synthase n=1 Tax=Streptomyces lonarensis TaxID=700599 RepID=A0A7X6CZW9_9ACTN|nr:salicylate synthase [Streptomyces lonarensis]NJQ05524.1 salicylate synthase [Streptomyces lonarensis]
MTTLPVERTLALTGDPVAVAAALAAATDAPYLLYEQPGSVVWSEGESAVVEVFATRVRLLRGRAEPIELPAGADPLAAAGRLLQGCAVGAGLTSHGWVTYELTHRYHAGGNAGQEEGVGLLARFVVPQREVELTASGAVLRAPDQPALDRLEARLRAADASPLDPPASRLVVDLDQRADRYLESVAETVRRIRAGALTKAIISRPVTVQGEVDLAATYVAGRRSHQPARSFLLRHGGWEAAGFSPEIVARVDADGLVTAQPLAGTRALTGELRGDAARREELHRDAKEVYEHAVSVRLVQEELDAVCEPASVRTEDFMSVEERGSVQHLASRLRGRLASGRTGWDAFAALFPAVTASGIPKAAALPVIDHAEGGPRGLYSGAVVRLEADGTLDAALVLRTVLRRGARTWLRAGAGVVAASDPDRELEETREKLRAVSGCLVPAGDAAADGRSRRAVGA